MTPRLVTVWVDIKEPKVVYARRLQSVGRSISDESEHVEAWECASPFGIVIVRCEGIAFGNRIEVEGALGGIRHVLKKLDLDDMPQSIQSVVIESRKEFPGSYAIC